MLQSSFKVLFPFFEVMYHIEEKGHSTNHAIITLVEKGTKALDTGKIVVGVYLSM